ncbi:hypothetical protein ACOKGD_13905 [Microbacterium phosphatis]|uniref:hypothetical protein n=1 Tax=Microbacterium phosphatis TaxID=3140248 RepID=UPI003140C51A
MPRPKSPCGTYSAYQRHLRAKEPIDAACRRAQRDHNANRSRLSLQSDTAVQPAPIPVPPQEMFRRCAVDLVGFAERGDLFAVDDLMAEMSGLLDEWRGA